LPPSVSRLSGIPANLLSLGALDFGMIVEGAVVMIENIVRLLSHGETTSGRSGQREDPAGGARGAAPGILFHRHHHHGLSADLHLAGGGGRLFKPMAWTVAFALLGALIFSMLIGPVLASVVYPKGTRNGAIRAWYGLRKCTIGF
jgi:heavy metal efflux system protein